MLCFRCQRSVRTFVAKGSNRLHGKLFDRSQPTSHGPQKSEVSVAEIKVRTPKRSGTLPGRNYIIITKNYY